MTHSLPAPPTFHRVSRRCGCVHKSPRSPHQPHPLSMRYRNTPVPQGRWGYCGPLWLPSFPSVPEQSHRRPHSNSSSLYHWRVLFPADLMSLGNISNKLFHAVAASRQMKKPISNNDALVWEERGVRTSIGTVQNPLHSRVSTNRRATLRLGHECSQCIQSRTGDRSAWPKRLWDGQLTPCHVFPRVMPHHGRD